MEKTEIVAYSLVDKTTRKVWPHSKRKVYDTMVGLKRGYESMRWVYGYYKETGVPYDVLYAKPFPGPFEIVEVRYNESP